MAVVFEGCLEGLRIKHHPADGGATPQRLKTTT
jgi:hypothetical protein